MCAFKILRGTPTGKRLLGRRRLTPRDNIGERTIVKWILKK